jgi:hypothetical protein
MWVAEPIYKLLPAGYVVAGVAVLALSDNIVGLGSGGLLIAAGVIIWKLRRDASRAQRPARRQDR